MPTRMVPALAGVLMAIVGCGRPLAPEGDVPFEPESPGRLCVLPSNLDLGTIDVGDRAAATFSLQSCGEGPVVLQDVTSLATWLDVQFDGPISLAPDEMAVVSIVAEGRMAGAHSASIQITHDAGHTQMDVVLEVRPRPDRVHITDFSPSIDVGQEVGAELTIRGSGFVVPVYNAATQRLTNQVHIGNVRLTKDDFVLPRSSSTQLVVRIPRALDDGTLDGAGREVEVRVENPEGMDRKVYRVWPSTAVVPDPHINLQSDTPPGVDGPQGGNVLFAGESVRVHGQHFSLRPKGNLVTLEFGDDAQIMTEVSVNADGTQLSFFVPVDLPIPFGNLTSAQLQVAVDGAAAPATVACRVIRTR